MFGQDIKRKAEKINKLLQDKKVRIACAESCTGGLLSALFTEIEDASKIFDRGFITYSNQAKIDLLEVKPRTIENYGAVSEETAKEMAKGAIKNSLAQISVAITGIAGPGGGSAQKPVGLVYIAYCKTNLEPIVKKYNFSGNRMSIRMSSVIQALDDLKDFI